MDFSAIELPFQLKELMSKIIISVVVITVIWGTDTCPST